MLTRRTLLKAFAGGVATLFALVAYPFVEVMARPRLTQYAVTPRRWTPGLKLRVVVLADIHACEPWMSLDRIGSICSAANALNGDVILLLGDYVSGMNLLTEHIPPADWSQSLSVLKAPLGVHAVLGNHDHYEDLFFQRNPFTENIAAAALRAVGISTYINEAVRLEKDGQSFWLAGLGDQMAPRPGKDLKQMRMRGIDDLPGTLAQIDDDSPVLLMAHEPDIFPQVSERVSLTLSGHTHGGQINILGWQPAAASQGSRRYPAGHYREGERDLIVSRGLGCSILPVRVGSRPEIVVIELG
ncbi:Putative metallophosphoesterase YkuE [Neorhizobium galegae bv. officinalis]|uniref:Putative metallophosphoesterase YkuE n=1 Tax=Neorhizobium galegae bv. officinalis TaxID=323656 RepID=A0A0T7FJ55_NEOGA|nr:metallophosphoesterase [Neorhizobium galegae]CDZ35050.1 Putative metallophosphoesterase YkuE [Neorhizobium galegae bv. officinalis]